MKGERPLRPQDNQSISDEIWELLQACWDGDPIQRPTAIEVCQILRETKLPRDPLLRAREPITGHFDHKDGLSAMKIFRKSRHRRQLTTPTPEPQPVETPVPPTSLYPAVTPSRLRLLSLISRLNLPRPSPTPSAVTFD
jgi:hypothetical protein